MPNHFHFVSADGVPKRAFGLSLNAVCFARVTLPLHGRSAKLHRNIWEFFAIRKPRTAKSAPHMMLEILKRWIWLLEDFGFSEFFQMYRLSQQKFGPNIQIDFRKPTMESFRKILQLVFPKEFEFWKKVQKVFGTILILWVELKRRFEKVEIFWK